MAQSHGWSLEGVSLYELEAMQLAADQQEYSVFHPAEVELGETTKRIFAQIEQINPTRAVFDSFSELRLLSQSALRYRREILGLKKFFAGRNCTVLLLDDGVQNTELQFQSICHGVIRLERENGEYGITRRRMQVVKMRAVKFREGFHDYSIHTGGLAVYPRLVASEHRENTDRPRVLSGLAELDALLGGGLERGTSCLIMGPAGSGKSTLATQYVHSALKRGEHVACYIFEENRQTFLNRSAGLQLGVDEFLGQGLLHLEQVDPAERSPGEFIQRVRNSIEKGQARMVVIDSLNGYLSSMPSEQFLLIQMHELLTYCSQKGVLTILIMAQHGLMGHMQAPVEVSYLADALLLLRFFEAAGEVRQALSVLKKRTGGHERTIRELRFSSKGIRIGEPLRYFSGVMTGVPKYEGTDSPLLKAEHGRE